MSLFSNRSLWVAAALILPAFSPCAAEDHFITIGGGPNPQSNQVSLESNVLFHQRVMTQVRPDRPDHDLFFADGDIDKPDLQYLDADADVPPAQLWMSRLFGDESAIRQRYRDHAIDDVTGPSRKDHLRQAFYELAQRVQAGDRVILYVTGHGGSAQDAQDHWYPEDESDPGNPYDTTIALWDDESLSVSELDSWLNRFPTQTRVVMIMAQCHSGGFAHAIFHQADRKQGLNPQLRCGFFSQRHDRAAAGCTPEIDETNYREYSSYFWEGIAGVSRTGVPVESCDCNGDGRVSLNEAHTHAIVASETIDIPVTTSEALLRRYSKIAAIDQANRADRPAGSPTTDSDDRGGGFFNLLFGGQPEPPAVPPADTDPPPPTDDEEAPLLARDQTVAQLLAIAGPDQQTVITRLCEAIQVEPTVTVQQVRQRCNRLRKELQAALVVWQTDYVTAQEARGELSGAVALQWPELLSEGYVPLMAELTGKRADEFTRFVTTLPQCDAYEKSQRKVDASAAKHDQCAITEAKAVRLVRMLENVLLEQNLPRVAKPSIVRHYRRLVDLEQECLSLPR